MIGGARGLAPPYLCPIHPLGNAAVILKKGVTMDLILERYRGISVVLQVAGERLLFPVAVIVALMGAAVIASELVDIWVPSNTGAYQL